MVGRHPGQAIWGIWVQRAEAVLPADAVHPLPVGLDPIADALQVVLRFP
ncbi:MULTISPECIES: hypothetical protein [unclassified Micromonospora]